MQFVQPLIAPFLWAKLLKRHKKALGQAQKSGAEGVGLKLLKESGAIFLVHIRFVLILSS